MRVSGLFRVREADDTEKVFAGVFTDVVEPDGAVSDPKRFEDISGRAIEQIRGRTDIDGIVFLPAMPIDRR